MRIHLAGGGTGGHIFPNLAILERLRERVGDGAIAARFYVSNRPLDAQLLRDAQLPFSALPAAPWSARPWRWPGFYAAWRRSVSIVKKQIRQEKPIALVATGGFVSGPAIAAARSLHIPCALVNLDAVPGLANRLLARRATAVFTAYPHPSLPGARPIALPLRRCALAATDPAEARRELGLDPHRPTLLVMGGSQGARSVNQALGALVESDAVREALADWQVLHLAGNGKHAALQHAYKAAGLNAVVESFCDRMGLAWSAADLAICRAGASTVAEAWAAAVPTIFLPYPYHKDQHQKLNAQPMADAGGALIVDDAIDPQANAQKLAPLLVRLCESFDERWAMQQALQATEQPDGAAAVAEWIAGLAD